MSVLLFNPKLHFDFDKKPRKSKLPKQIISAIFLLGVFLFGVFGFVRSQTHVRLSVQQKPLTSQYSNITEIPNTQKLFTPAKAILSEPELPVNPVSNFELNVPILMYHYTPSNFEAQLEHLQTHGYHSITMNDLGHHLFIGTPLPAKPVVITFDDGFSDQEKAFDLLRKYNMKATFYLILGGTESNYCIGITRTNLNCGDNYFNWSQIKSLIDSGLIEIGAHTLNHPDLPSLSLERQEIEISESKKQLESIYNITITSLAYPYGRYNQQTIDLAAKAGYLTAVTTEAGSFQSSGNRLRMPRMRNTLLLP